MPACNKKCPQLFFWKTYFTHGWLKSSNIQNLVLKVNCLGHLILVLWYRPVGSGGTAPKICKGRERKKEEKGGKKEKREREKKKERKGETQKEGGLKKALKIAGKEEEETEKTGENMVTEDRLRCENIGSLFYSSIKPYLS